MRQINFLSTHQDSGCKVEVRPFSLITSLNNTFVFRVLLIVIQQEKVKGYI